MNSFNIRVKPDFTFDRVQVAGREFLKRDTRIAEQELNDEIRNSPLLIVEPIADITGTEVAPIETPTETTPPAEPIVSPAASEAVVPNAAETINAADAEKPTAPKRKRGDA